MEHSAPTLSGTAAPDSPADSETRSWPAWAAPAALGAILLLAAVLYSWSLGSLGWANTYYSAAAKSMGKNWTNFLFGAYDPAGVVTVDKPPASLWPQVISSKIFGMHGWALLLPQVVEGVAAVFVLHRTVRRWAGEGAALLAALILTLTPITVAINRDNNPDTLLVLFLVTAAYTLTRALQAQGRSATWWLCASGFLIGCGFLTKMLAAWMVVPAFAAAWLVGAAGPWAARLWRLLAAGAALLVSSMWWVAMVALWPGDHPYVGGSTDGSAWDLVVGYNGLGRVFGQDSTGGGNMMGAGATFGGGAGAGRLFGEQVAGQISWLLPGCAVALAVAVACAVLRRRGRLSDDTVLASSGWVLWGTWLVVCGAVFSTQEGIFHPYYTTQLAPAIAAILGGLLTALTRLHRAGNPWVAPIAATVVAVTTVWAVVIIRRDPDWHGWLTWPVLPAGIAAVVLLVLSRSRARLLVTAGVTTVVSMLIAPGAWAVTVSGSTTTGSNPIAGPATAGFGGAGMRSGTFGGASGNGAQQGGGGTGSSGLPSGMPTDMQGFPGGTGSGQPGGGMPSGMPTDMEGFPGGTGSGRPGGGMASEMPSGGQEMPTNPTGGSGSGRQEVPSFGGGAGGMGGNVPSGASTLTSDQRKILAYAVAHAPRARIKLAVEGGAMSSAAFILNSDETVAGMGGFGNTDDAPSVAQLTKWTKSGELRYILGSDTSNTSGGTGMSVPGMSKDSPVTQRSDWIKKNCTKVPASAYGGSSGKSSQQNSGGAMGFGVGGTVLYDCAAK
ncbi:ArnT family glycosyltransferase [Streptomyces sp. NPDC102405]|uniref:ArnT family glycosyltransferase n=1 Tax=Streptomyces sp. NPDC102405 TaxID=3366170 RepID=UPI0038208533